MTETYTYDSTGNLDVKAGVDLNYNDAAHVHAVTHLGSTQKYWYDANGNQITRIVGSDTFTLIYDAENRLVEVKKNSVSMATFVYDGDGRRVKSIVNGTTTYFIGAHYELTGSQVTKYYFAGATRIAMRKYTIPSSMAVEYFLGDHLGSTSITTNANGAKVSEMRYKPWGEVRSWWTASLSTTPAYKLPQYTFTGQFSHMDDPSTAGVTEGFGLMFYNARWYDPYLNHFTQPDSIVPDPSNPQDWNRYSYARFNPIKYTDPSGHTTMCGASCEEEYEKPQYSLDDVLAKYGVTLKGNWDIRYKAAVVLGVLAVAGKFGEVSGKSPSEIFKSVYGSLTLTWGSCSECNGSGGYTYGRSDIRFVSMAGFHHSDWALRARNNVIHELGHAFNWAMDQDPELLLTSNMDRYKSGFNELLLRSSDPNSFSGFASRNSERVWVQNPATTATEVFADMFLGWVMNTWEQAPNSRYGVWTDAGTARSNWMATNMVEWLTP